MFGKVERMFGKVEHRYARLLDWYGDTFFGFMCIALIPAALIVVCILLSCLGPQWYLQSRNAFTDAEAEQVLELIVGEDVDVISATHEWFYTNNSTIVFRTTDGDVHEARCFSDTKNKVTCQITNWMKIVE